MLLEYKQTCTSTRTSWSHVLSQFAYSLSKTEQKPGDEWSATDVREMNTLVLTVKMTNPGVIIRWACFEKIVVMTTFDFSFASERHGRSPGGFLMMMTTRGVEKRASVCTMSEFHSTLIHRMIGSTLAAETSTWAKAVDRLLCLLFLLEALLTGEPQCGSDWPTENGLDSQETPNHGRSAGYQGPGGGLCGTNQVGTNDSHAGRHLDNMDAHDRGIQVLSGKWQ